jgi:hypothetical protein
MRHPVLCSLGVALVLTGCDMNESGNLAATKFGDLSHPAERGSPIDGLRTACGEGELIAPGGDVVRRLPYIQQTTTAAARVGWVTVLPEGERAIVSTPEHAPVMTADAIVQDGNQRNAGEKQMWASLGGLQPASVYCYELANGSPMSGRTGFKTAPPLDSTETIRFMAFGDSGGGGADQHALRDQMLDLPYDLIVHTGDLAYDDGTIGQFEENVFGVYYDLFRNLPFFPAAGNHEYRTMQGAPFREVFALPGDAARKYYSYDWGRIHFIALDTEDDYETQAAWMDQDLARTDRPWKIVYLHKPPYSSGNHGSDTRLRAALAPVLEKHEVQLVLAGHDHNYERMHTQNGVDYVVTGGGGKGTYDVGSSSFTAFSESVIHFVTVEVGVDEAILHAIDATGVEFDSMVIPRVR